MSELIANDLEEVIQNDVTKSPENKFPTYGYGLKRREGRKDIDVIAGADHGACASRYVSKINLKSPYECRRLLDGSRNIKLERFSRIIIFALMECQLDKSDVQRHLKDDLNDGFKKVENGKLVGVIDEKNMIRAKVIPKEAECLGTFYDEDTDKVNLCYKVNIAGEENEEKKIELVQGLTKDTNCHQVWEVVEQFSLFVTGI